MKICAIMQPTYLPWYGYFNLASSVDTFIFLDDVQYERKSWQNHNRILANGKIQKLTVPVKKMVLSTLIKSIEIENMVNWKSSHIQAIFNAYPSLLLDRQTNDQFFTSFEATYELLADLNIALIRSLFKLLHISCNTIRASELDCGGKRSEHLAQICHAVNADAYLSPQGARKYLEYDGFSEIAKIPVYFQNFDISTYSQRNVHEFITHLSIIDMLGNCGAELTRSYIVNRDNNVYNH